MDIEEIELKSISDENPLKLVFKMGEKLLNMGITDEKIYKAKIELAQELKNYDKVKKQ